MADIDHTTAWVKFKDWINRVIEMRGSDILLVPNYKPMARVNGKLQPIDDFVLTGEQTHWVAISLFGSYGRHTVDPAYEGGVVRQSRTYGDTIAHISVCASGGEKTVNVRLHGGEVPSIEKANLPERITELLDAPNGLILVSGPHGSGKTTALYAMVDWINRNRPVHICTVEKPRYFLFKPLQAVVQQREVGLDGPTPSSLVQASMEQDPDVLMVGEVEDFETLASVINAAETGHLVFVQIHANSEGDAVSRLVEAAPQGMREMVKRQLGECLRGVTHQRLLRRAGGKGRVAAYGIIGEGARKFCDGGTPDAGFYITRIQDEIKRLEDAGVVGKDESERVRREVGA